MHLVEAVRRFGRPDSRWPGAGRNDHRAVSRYLAGLPAADRERLRVLGPWMRRRSLTCSRRPMCSPCPRAPIRSASSTWRHGSIASLWSRARLGRLRFDQRWRGWAAGALRRRVRSRPSLSRSVDRSARRGAMGLRGEQKVYDHHTWDRKYTLVRDLYLRLVEERSHAHPEPGPPIPAG